MLKPDEVDMYTVNPLADRLNGIVRDLIATFYRSSVINRELVCRAKAQIQYTAKIQMHIDNGKAIIGRLGASKENGLQQFNCTKNNTETEYSYIISSKQLMLSLLIIILYYFIIQRN